MTAHPDAPARRSYDGTLRRARAAETRERIVSAGVELGRASSIRDWRSVTIRAVADRAGVHERTVYRHFANERALRDAVLQRLEADAGIDLERMQLADVADVTAKIFRHVSEYPTATRPPLDPTLAAANRRQHEALVAAIGEHAADWPEADRRLAAAMLDVLWSVACYERLSVDWALDRAQATRAVMWVVGLIDAAVRGGRAPAGARRA